MQNNTRRGFIAAALAAIPLTAFAKPKAVQNKNAVVTMTRGKAKELFESQGLPLQKIDAIAVYLGLKDSI